MSFGSFVLLPNITGGFSQRSAGASGRPGCISVSLIENSGYRLALDTSAQTGDFFNFNASCSSSLYGASNTVQPNALVFNYIIKY